MIRQSVQGNLITSSYEINRVISDISKEQSPLTLYPDDSLSTLTSYIDEVDCQKGYMLFKSPEPIFRQPLLIKRTISITCKYRDSIITIPEIELIDEQDLDKSRFIGSIPKRIFILQRRSYYRQEILNHRQLDSKILICEDFIRCRLLDISLGGCKIELEGDFTSKININQSYQIVIKIDKSNFLSTNIKNTRIKYVATTNTTQAGYEFIELSNKSKEFIVDLVSITFQNKKLNKLHPKNFEIDKVKSEVQYKEVTNISDDEKINIRKIHQDGLTTIQSIINHFTLGKEIPINQIQDYCFRLLKCLQYNRQSLVISSRLRTTENYFNQCTLSFIINLSDFLTTTLKEVNNIELCDAIIGCLLQNLPQNNNFLHNQTRRENNINELKNRLIIWHKYIEMQGKLSLTTFDVIRNNLKLSDSLSVEKEQINSRLNLISLISSTIHMHEQQSHITKENKYFYHPINFKIFERSLSKKIHPIILKKLKEHHGNYPLGSTIQTNKKLALVMRHDKNKHPSYIRLVYDIESGCLTKPLDIMVNPSDKNIIEGIFNPSYYKIHTGLINNPLDI